MATTAPIAARGLASVKIAGRTTKRMIPGTASNSAGQQRDYEAAAEIDHLRGQAPVATEPDVREVPDWHPSAR